MASLEGTLAKQGTTASKQQTDFLKQLGPGFGEALSKLLQGTGINQLGLNQQFAQIGGQAQADINQLQQGAATRGLGNFGGAQAIQAARQGTAAGQKTQALASEQDRAHQRTLQNLGFLQENLFGGALDASGLAIGAQQAGKDRASAERSAMIGAVGSVIGGFCWVARAVFGAADPKWRQVQKWIAFRSPDWFFNFYHDHGEAFSKVVERWFILRAVLRPAFEVLAFWGRRL